MPRLTSQELQEAKERKRREEERQRQEAEEARQRAHEERIRRHEAMKGKLSEAHRRQAASASLDSSCTALYTELDKLTKKAPKEQVSDLELEYINNIIRDVKQLVPEDELLQRVTVFEAAGDNPEYRNALLVISQVRAALRRFGGCIDAEITKLQRELAEHEKELEKPQHPQWGAVSLTE